MFRALVGTMLAPIDVVGGRLPTYFDWTQRSSRDEEVTSLTQTGSRSAAIYRISQLISMSVGGARGALSGQNTCEFQLALDRLHHSRFDACDPIDSAAALIGLH
jgi:hypothetical protein